MEPKISSIELLTFLLLIFTSIPQNSLQQQQVSSSNIIETHCIFSYDRQNRYNCYLFNVRTQNATDVLNIVGTHMLNHTDADVHGVQHINTMMYQFNGEILRRFPNLRRIDLRATFLQSISPSAFDICGQLEELDIGANSQLLELPARMLANCENFKRFIAGSSRFPSLPDGLFGATRSLEVISLPFSRLTSFPDNLLTNMPNLTRFDVRNNQLRHISPSNFISALNLQDIDISMNSIIDTQTVVSLLNGHFGLRRIILSSNPFPMFNFNFLTQFQNLEELWIGSNNNLTGIGWQFLPRTLQVLRIYSVSEPVPENAFVGVPNLTYLDISGYGIKSFEPDTFKPLVNLDRLDIMGTHITTFHPDQFTSQGKLRALHLSFNDIEELPDRVFTPLVNLGFNESVHGLFMFGNRLRRLSASSFGQHPHLNYIYFENNQINEIQRGLFSRFNPQPALISFVGNICVQRAFFEEVNLDENPLLEPCFNNFEGITTTTPSSAVNTFRKFMSFVSIFVGILSLAVNNL
ncbi:leucine-rich repeat-containing protein 15-like [Chironomus tepperi]|uniref:leucine-rich repeat-containing protein 15-like n=1 Tax=Chironomus tepperi TaxID=113505 RepID=UPI00391F9683